MNKRNPNPIDVHVGHRVRMRRLLVGMSQEKLGEELGLTFQQVQKYEKGANRVSASRLYQMARILGVPVQFFYDDMETSPANKKPGGGMSEGQSGSVVMDFLGTSDGIQLSRAFSELHDPKVRRRIIDLVKTLAESQKS